MQFLSVIPEQVESAAQDLAGIRSALSASYAAAAGPTTAVVSAAEDEVSTAIASIFGAYGRQCQVLSAQASAFHDEFVNLLKTGATAYRNTEFANAQSNVLNAVNAPARSLLGHPSAAESVQNSAPTLGGGHSKNQRRPVELVQERERRIQRRRGQSADDAQHRLHGDERDGRVCK